MKKNLTILILGILCMSIGACGKKDAEPIVDVEMVKIGDVKKTIKTDGRVKSADYDRVVTTDLVSCPIKEIYVEQGEFVEKGQLLCVLDVSKVKLKKEQSANVEAVRSGIISEVFITEGLCASDGKIAGITDNKNLCVEIWLNEKDMAFINNGMKSKITAKEIADISSVGKISMLSQINEENGFKAVVNIDYPLKFKLGMDVAVCFDIAQWNDVLMINPDYILGDKNKSYVLSVNENEDHTYTIKHCPINVVGVGDEYVAAKAKGLSEGDYIVTDPDKYEEDEIVGINLIDKEEK